MTQLGAVLCALSLLWVSASVLIVVADAIETPPPCPLPGGNYNNSMHWGSWRPGVYFGMKNRSPKPILTGMAWGPATNPTILRHEARHEDNLKFGWTSHDGSSFGVQEITDERANVRLKTYMIKDQENHANGGSWTNRFIATPIGAGLNDPISFYYYFAFPADKCQVQAPQRDHKTAQTIFLSGSCKDTGPFTIVVRDATSSNKSPKYDRVAKAMGTLKDLDVVRFVGRHVPNDDDLWKVKSEIIDPTLGAHYQTLFSQFIKYTESTTIDLAGAHPMLVPLLSDEVEEKSNVFVFQRVLQPRFDLDVIYLSHNAHRSGGNALTGLKASRIINRLSGRPIDAVIEKKSAAFDKAFEQIFHLDNLPEQKMNQWLPLAKYAFSNLIGSMGHFYGDSAMKIFNKETRQPTFYKLPEGELFTATPSRSFFPRGFLWDEGFHQLLISQWNPLISLDVLGHWLNRMEADGWIPREQIVGPEARSRVPQEFVAQSPHHANPPTLLLALKRLTAMTVDEIASIIKSRGLISADHKHAAEEHTVDASDEAGDLETDEESLANEEALLEAQEIKNQIDTFVAQSFDRVDHWYQWFKKSQRSPLFADAFLWQGRTPNHTMASGLDDYPRTHVPTAQELHLDLQCWMIFASQLMTDLAVTAQRDATPYRSDASNFLNRLDLFWSNEAMLYSDVAVVNRDTQAVERFTHHHGYVTLFPLLMRLLDVNSPRFKTMLLFISDPNALWTEFGLRSLSASDPFYLQDENYWRGSIWININYMTLAALHSHYLSPEMIPQYADELTLKMVQRIYSDLRTNLINNMINVFRSTGFIWEQYTPTTGSGKGTKPFTGWSSLIVNIMAERYY